MSLPFPRRIVARAALLVAAGAAPLVGAAGTAGAAETPQSSGLDRVNSAIDQDSLGQTVTTTSTRALKPAGHVGGKLNNAVPKADRAFDTLGGTTTAKGTKATGKKKATGKTTRATGSLVGSATKLARGGEQPFGIGKGLPATGKSSPVKLPVQGLPLA